MTALLGAVAAVCVIAVVVLAVFVVRLTARISAQPATVSAGSATTALLPAGTGGGYAPTEAQIEAAEDLRRDAERAAAETRREAQAAAQAAAEAAQREADALRSAAARDAEQTKAAAQADLASLTAQLDRLRAEAGHLSSEVDERKADYARREQRLAEREERIDGEARRLEARDRELAAIEAAIEQRKQALDAAEADYRRELERISGLTAADAKAEIVAAIEQQAKRDAALLIREIEAQARSEAEMRARKIITTSIQRLATEQTTESVITTLHLPSDEMKGRIIGREGRNIRAFETTTGVNLIIDDTPEAVLLSCFDPVRREVGRLTLEQLVHDGRIHPHRIEEVYERSKVEVEQLCQRAGEDALVDVGITDIHPELVKLLGQLRYRTSYGQNVLKHLVESGHIAGMMADELGLDRALMIRCAFLHDIGKALTHEVQGSHAIIGAEIARKYGEHDDVVHAIEAHHNEVEVRTVEAVLTQAADAISGGRPGARRESLEHYVQRLQRIEEIAGEKTGVERVFAMQAGREIRVMVKPDEVDDLGAQVLAREVAKQIEDELTYPGQIRVTVVRESRATELAK